MKDIIYEPIGEMLAIAVYGLVVGVLTVVGLFAELAGVSNLLAGQMALGAWEVWMGSLGLYAGVYLVGYHELRPRLQARLGDLD